MAGSDHPAVATVGRAVDLAEIAALVAGAGGPDNPATVLVTGLPGIGRSTVLDAAVAAHPGPTLTLRCLPEDRAHRPGALTTRLARLITLEPSGDLADELRRRCAAATLLLAVDDLHWADDDCVDLLARLS